jgi:C4-dicarboxylate transporter
MVFAIGLSCTALSGSSKIIGYFSFAVSIIIFLYCRAPLNVWKLALEENLYLIVLFALVPLLKIPIQHGGYFNSLRSFFRRYINTINRFYLFTSFLSAFIGVLVNLAVVPLVHEISKASDINNNKKLLCSAVSRGFTTCIMWSPTMAAVALIIKLTNAEWIHFFPYGLLFSVIVGVIGYIMTLYEYKDTICPAIEYDEEKIDLKKLLELSMFATILILSIALVSHYLKIDTITVVSCTALVFPIIWMTLIKRWPLLCREFKGDYFKHSLPNLSNEIVLFVGAGLLATSITYSHLGNYIPKILSLLVGNNVLWLTVAIILGTIILSAIGIHPIIIIAIIGETVKASAYGITPVYMALILSISWAMGVTVSPAAANIIVLAGLAKQSPLQVGIRWNGSYVLISSAILIVILTLLRVSCLI